MCHVSAMTRPRNFSRLHRLGDHHHQRSPDTQQYPFLQRTPSESFGELHSKVAFCGGGAEVAVERATPTCARPQLQSGPSRGAQRGSAASPEAATERGGNAATCGPRTSGAPLHTDSAAAFDSLDAAGLRSEHYLAMQPLPQQPREHQTTPTTTYPPYPAQDSPGSFQCSEISLASPPMSERTQHAEAGLSVDDQSGQTQSTSRRTELVPAFGRGEKKDTVGAKL